MRELQELQRMPASAKDQRDDADAVARPPAGKPCSETSSISQYPAARNALRQAMDSMHGHAVSALLGDIHRIAESKFGFEGTVADAVLALQTDPDLRLEPADAPEQTRVYFTQGSARSTPP
ncbi:MAG: hypothetical protein WD847_02715 [Pirellulales bacterium]